MKNFINHIKQNAALCSVLFCFSILNNAANAQYNLVNNYSFENYTQCPKKLNNPLPTPWYMAGKYLPLGYLNACDTSIYCSVPINAIKNPNFQYAHSGNAYVFLDYVNGGSRQYLQSKLKDSLRTNKKYYIEFFVNIPNSLKFACNNVALLLTNTAVYVDTMATPYGVLPANPQVYNYGNPVLGDTLNWTKVSAVYTAQGGEQFITLGNFKTNAQTTLQQIQATGYYGAGYIIDDVSVIPLDSFCLKAFAGKDTTINAGDSVFIGSYTNGIDSLLWLQNGTTPKDSTRPGFYVSPSSSTFYVLHQVVNGCFSSDTVYINVQPLPLKFLSFSIFPSFGGSAPSPLERVGVRSLWQTMNEINVSHFNILRSTNAKDFETIGKLKANNKAFNEYNFIDELIPNTQYPTTLYYKIAAIDNDGKTTYSTTQSFNIQHSSFNITIYPNPAKNVVNVVSNNIAVVSIFDMLGKQLITKKYNGDNLVTLSLNNINAGVYLVKVADKKGNVKTSKLIVE